MATILVVDDRQANRAYLVTLLDYSGHRLLEAADGAEALQKTRAERPDLVVVDILMPTMDGFEFVRQLRADPVITQTRVIFYTATYLETEARRLAEACGVAHIIVKPSEPQAVLDTVNAALGLSQPAHAPAPTLEFDREHLRLLTNKLSEKVNELEALNAELEQRVAERTRELTESNERLKELDQLKSKFVADVSHELRGPVANLKLYLDLLENVKPEKSPHYLSVLKQQAGRLAQLVEDILDLSRLELGGSKIAFDAVDLNKLVEMIVTAHQPRAEVVGLRLAFMPHAELLPVRGELNQLARMITNLVINAITYTPTGEVLVSTSLAPERGQVCLQVEDTGIGIAPQDLPHLFERFYRGRRPDQPDIPGTGLGLSIAKEIVDLHGGQIEVKSEVGKGSAIRVWLPLYEA